MEIPRINFNFNELKYIPPDWKVVADDPKNQRMADFTNRMIQPYLRVWKYWWMVGGDD